MIKKYYGEGIGIKLVSIGILIVFDLIKKVSGVVVLRMGIV